MKKKQTGGVEAVPTLPLISHQHPRQPPKFQHFSNLQFIIYQKLYTKIAFKFYNL